VVHDVLEILLSGAVPLNFFLKFSFRHGVSPFSPLKGILIQGPMFMSFFFAVSNASFYPSEFYVIVSFEGKTITWFTFLSDCR
jgi:membrane protein insertase Oxa1/YidC/SpoIIIJ